MARRSVSTPGIDPLRVQIGTFNCNLQGSSSVSPDLTHWLVPTISEKSASYNVSADVDGRTAPDFYAVGFQELMPLPDGFANNEKAQEAISNTDRSIRRAIRPQAALTRKDGKYPPGGGPEDYVLIGKASMVGIVLFVYARERRPTMDSGRGLGAGISALPSAAERVKEVRTATVGTGLLGLMGNKGAAGVRVVVGGAVDGQADEALTFVTAHLAAHDHNVARRNRDWKNIVSRLVFPPESAQPLPTPTASQPTGKSADSEKSLDGLTERYETVHAKRGEKQKGTPLDKESHGLYETSHLFVFGDLNYRIGFNTKPSPALARKGHEAEKLKKSDIKRKINQADWRTLATYDQLSIEHASPGGPRVFHGLVEPDLRTVGYGPTYKYKVDKEARKRAEKAAEKDGLDAVPEVGGANAAVLSSKRVPGWTDRILWASNGAQALKEGDTLQGVQLELLRSIMRYTHSDHKPVTAILQLPPPSGLSLHPSVRPYAIDPTWRTRQSVGTLLDRSLGNLWCLLILAGAGNVLIGISELVVLATLSVWWLGAGGGEQSDMGYWLGSVLGRP